MICRPGAKEAATSSQQTLIPGKHEIYLLLMDKVHPTREGETPLKGSTIPSPCRRERKDGVFPGWYSGYEFFMASLVTPKDGHTGTCTSRQDTTLQQFKNS